MQLSEPFLNFHDWDSYQRAIKKWKVKYSKLTGDQRLNKALSRSYALSTSGLSESVKENILDLLRHQQRIQIYTAKIARELMGVRGVMCQKWDAIKIARKIPDAVI